MNKYVFLCSVVLYDEYDVLLMEESLLIENEANTEMEAELSLSTRLSSIQLQMSDKLSTHLSLNCHCPFPMDHEVSADLLSEKWLMGRFSLLNSYQIESCSL